MSEFGKGYLSRRTIKRGGDLFQRGVAGAFADAVDGALNLPDTTCRSRQTVRDCHAEIVMAVCGEGDVSATAGTRLRISRNICA